MWFFDLVFYGRSLLVWLIAVGVFIVGWVLLTAVKWVVVNRVARSESRTASDIDDFIVMLVARTLYVASMPLLQMTTDEPTAPAQDETTQRPE